jgi:hypothetical protein
MTEIKEDLETSKFGLIDQDWPKFSSDKLLKRNNIKGSLAYALFFNSLLIFSCIALICLFYVIGGILLNPLFIFGIVIVILLFALIETISLVEKDIPKKNVGEDNDANNH